MLFSSVDKCFFPEIVSTLSSAVNLSVFAPPVQSPNVGQNIAATRCTLECVLAFGIRCLMYDGVIEELSSCCWK